MPLVSTIIPVFNRRELLLPSVQSVLNQDYRPIEIVIVDDGSTDSTLEIAQQLASDFPEIITVLSIRNSGPGIARQVGLEASRGDYIQYLDSDDLLLPGKFASQVAALEGDPECVAAYGKTRYFDFEREAPPAKAGKRTGERIRHMFPAHLQSRWWSTSSPLYRRQACEQAGPWTGLRNEEDWEYECRIAKLGGKLVFIDEFVSDINHHDGERLSHQGSFVPEKLRDRAEAHRLILQHAREAGILPKQPEMQHFARELFLLARQCGAAGLTSEAEMLFRLAIDASTPERARGADFRIFSLMSRIVGWRTVGLLSRLVDRLRSGQGEQ